MRLYLLPSSFSENMTSLEIRGKDYNYLINVLRLKKGQRLMGRDRSGGLWNLEITEVGKGCCVLSAEKADAIRAVTDNVPERAPLKPIVLYQCLPKGRKADDIIKKATEAGVRDIVLVKSRNCVASLEGKEEARLSRYDAVIAEAIQQSGSVVPTKVEGVIDIRDIPEDFKARSGGLSRLGLVLHQTELEEDQADLVSCLRGFDGITAVVVGPEGGLEEDECRQLMDCGFKAVLLKTNILRCETASIYAIGAIQTLMESGC
ncbi:MAG: 16S rRNA (uracil(1498)-N(3))-methyltransferase [Spirochaetales bacterium]|nr:16S rRNA (uracil(1498)-N(3))-methyltransferase [Spirochaetales bacterium]